MDTRTEKSRMKIDSLLNPGGIDYSIGNAHSDSQVSSNQYSYGKHQIYYNTSPRPVSIDNKWTGFHSASGSQQQCQDGPRQSHHPTSMGSSPKPYRFVQDSGNNGTDPRHVPGCNYNNEEMHFVWYHYIDLSQDWETVLEGFNRQFPYRQRLGTQGMKHKFYRFIKDKGAKRVKRGPKSFMKWIQLSYPWMREDHKTAIALQKHP
ncbi:uncharacterized protein N7473_001661 [Penicillium subrubescens]|nr:uncharacterized protein N7473_001661 [Penicillium subrubescens]KAJ5904745.1 hypothetical protein N7473_001661 [Penicillium subrubescens]